ncbi:enoyl-CoA hydratase-related protein [Asticcacaulis sp.]|uniref:enoyl-CoA hydratase-related protein n=1 Tax=Asticcacaulis sp. TaxID=1872648 RepID=UPI002CC86DF5|nr:enoyl-CoA hydratase-related protein [Asticcacaulis sp.]HTM80687.1 enoyl-CoA hydratase-related protein [Asticcacaulis sp.]
MQDITVEADERGVVRVTLNRPAIHNAFNEGMIGELTDAFADLGKQDGVRVIVLAGNGASFSAGADLNWMKRAAEQDEYANREDALSMARMFDTLNTCPKPTVALVQGAALGGGVGLVACCDVVITQPETMFGLTEVRLGLIPAVISPFVIAKVGQSAARRYMLTGERFTAVEAQRIGLVHEVSSALEAEGAKVVEALLAGGPEAIADAKDLIGDITKMDDKGELTAHRIATRRASDEGREGVAAFLSRRKPHWTL